MPRELLRTHFPVVVGLCATLLGCGSDDPARPQPANTQPVIASLTAFPAAIGPGDSTIVICVASDAENDSLVYDWVTDSRLIIKGNSPSNHERFDSPSPFQVFYHGPKTPFDSAWVECDVRDRRGGFTVRQVRILVNQ